MTSSELTELTAVQAISHIRHGELSAEKYMSILLEQYANYVDSCAFASVNTGGALQAARDVDLARASGKTLPVLAGLPLVAKDNINTTDLPTSGGTRSLKDFRPRENAPVLQKLLDSGAILFGKGNMHELSFGVTTKNTVFGNALNPYAQDSIVGGSSGGPAAAIAQRIVPAGLGTDTGGSVRIPASLCGIAGLRPTAHGTNRRYSADGVMPLSSTRDTIGPMARCVADLAMLDAVITGAQVAEEASLRGVRIGIPRKLFWESIDAETRACLEIACEDLEEAGVVLVEIDDLDIEESTEKASTPIVMYESLREIQAYLDTWNPGFSIDMIEEQIGGNDVRTLFALAKQMTPESYQQVMSVDREKLRSAYSHCFGKYQVEALMFPTTPVPASTQDSQHLELLDSVLINGVEANTFGTYTRNTNPGSTAGLPGLSIPVGLTKKGLPVGMALDAPEFHDARLLAIGLGIERVLGRLRAPTH
jgi:mandelamide amidase